MTVDSYPHTKHLMAAAVVGLLGQLTCLLFILYPNPYTTVGFLGPGLGLMVFALLIFGYVVWQDNKARVESVTERRYAPGETLFRQGDRGDRFYVIKAGRVEVIRESGDGEETVLARLGPGEYVGEMALLTDAPRNATVRAVDSVTALAIDRQDFQSLFASIPALRQSVDSAVQSRA